MAETAPIRLLIADDHPLIRAGLRDMIGSDPGIAIVAETGRGDEVAALYRAHRPDVALLDLRMPGQTGDAAMAEIRREFPDARLIALTHCQGEDDVHRALQAGARAYVLKTVDRATLVDTIKAVFAGLRPRGPGLLQRAEDGADHPPLTPRELEVLERLARGHDTDAIAAALGISPETTRVHVKHILGKLDVSSRSQAVALALQRGVVHLD